MAEIRTHHLLTLGLAVTGMQPIGKTPSGNRRIGLAAGGAFEGPRPRGNVLPDGADRIVGRSDGVTSVDVRIVLHTDDDSATGVDYRGLRHDRTSAMEKGISGQFVDPSEDCFRSVLTFATASSKYARLN
jgi:hypothetical protein